MTKLGAGTAVIAVAAAVGWLVLARDGRGEVGADHTNPELVALGQTVYAKHCASCHGANLQGEANWRTPKPEGGLRAPPHDASGHTWHHPDPLLFRITKEGGASVAPDNFKSNMPAFKGKLSDHEIWAVLAYIKSRWPDRVREIHAQINERARVPK